MRILCATDFSACSTTALRVAARLARRLDEGLVLVHAFQPAAAASVGMGGEQVVAFDRELRTAVEASLARAAAALRAEGVGVETRAEEGPPAKRIVQLARAMDARMIVLGSVGHGAVERLVVGSTTDRVLRTADVPVLAVRGRTEAFAQWGSDGRPLRVLAGIDASAASDAAVEWIRTLRRAGPVDVTFVHVFWPPAAPTPGAPEGSLATPDPVFVSEMEAGFRRRIGELPGEGDLRLRVWPALGSLAYALGRWADEMQADLVVLGNHRRGLLERLWKGSAVTGVLHHGRTSVLAVPGPAAAAEAGAAPPTPATEAAPPPEEATVENGPHVEAGAAKPAPLFRRILVPADLADDCAPALDLVGRLAGPGGGEVILLHVVQSVPGLEPEEEHGFYDRLVQRARAQLEPARRRLVEAGVAARLEIRIGDRAQAILQFAEEAGAELVVMASHPVDPRNPAGTIGTLSYKVGILAQCPVLLVK